ncbi:EAL domain-containing protein [Dickeya poaceiphila]|uniref:EAL domain-containing protein n=1 Tax=Dickeya poaceiphila TaxID=568768 RepID=A0A5B8I566_9GAMM|nr:EAL domain-containing protein [Dickeya poaceiphila]QDX29744.1 EAL domain-containing protein [Dickeya poaceiphila]
MRIQLEVDYVSQYFFSPVYHLDSRLMALEMVGRFQCEGGSLSIPQEILLGTLNHQHKQALLREQLAILKDKSAWFINNRVIVALKIDHTLTEILINDALLWHEFRSLPFLQLEINEHFPDISHGRDNPNLMKLSQSFHLWLDNFGAGNVNMKPFYDGVISCVKMDAGFINKLLIRPVSVSIVNPMLQVMKKQCPSLKVVAKGVDNIASFERVFELDVNAVQGQLWSPLPPEALDNALMPVACYG